MTATLRSLPPLARALLLAAVAAAFALRLIVPQGWMPAADASGIRFVLCTGTGPMAMADGAPMAGNATLPDGRAPMHPDGHADDHGCPFAPLAAALALPALVAFAVPSAAAFASPRPVVATVAVGRGLAAPPPPATGPPARS